MIVHVLYQPWIMKPNMAEIVKEKIKQTKKCGRNDWEYLNICILYNWPNYFTGEYAKLLFGRLTSEIIRLFSPSSPIEAWHHPVS